MSIKWISSAWQNDLQTTFPPDRRVYVDFRQQQYPEIAGSPTFTLITSADNQPGSHNFTGGYADYLLDMPSKFTLAVRVKPTFSYTGATAKYIVDWNIDATHRLSFLYSQVSHLYFASWQDGGTVRTLDMSGVFASDGAVQVLTNLAVTIDLTTGTNVGSASYYNGALNDSTWSGASDVKARNFPVMSVRNLATTVSEYDINYIRLFPNKLATAADVANNFRDLKEEEIVWHYNGHACGHTRCNVTPRVNSVDIERSIESPAGSATPNSANVNLLSPQGQFADDQYAAFAPASEIYNGTSAQKFMQYRCPVEIETWYGGLFELEFAGRVDENLFKRRSGIGDVSQVTISALDLVDDMRRRVRQKAYSYDSFSLSDPANMASSLIHVIGNMAMQTEIFNFLANSSWENTTAANSWMVLGGGATLTRTAGGILGSFTGNLLCATTATMTQTITYTGTRVLNVGQNWNLSMYGKSVTGITATLSLLELASGGTALQTVSVAQAFTTDLSKIEKTLTVGSSLAAKLQAKIALATAATFVMDAAMLVQNDQSYNWAFANNSDGAAGVFSADSAMSSVYSIAGFDVDDAVTSGATSIVSPWTLVEQGVSIWSYLSQIADATAVRYLGMDACGTLKYRTPFKTSYADPSSIFTISTSLQGIASTMELTRPNKIVVHGVNITKYGNTPLLWNATETGFFDRDTNGFIYESVANGATWPPPATYGEFWASYDIPQKTTPLGAPGGHKWLS